MNILFFQNCLSPHQMPYIKELPGIDAVDDVVVVIPFVDYDERKRMGWSAEKLLWTPGIDFHVEPSLDEVRALYEKYNNTDTYCMYSGITAFADLIPWFRMSLGYNVKRGVISEPPSTYNHPLWQHKLRFALKDWKYVKYIDTFFVMGDEFVPYYKFWSRRWKVVPFMYCTEWIERTMPVPNGKLKVLYVGTLSRLKNVQSLLAASRLLPREKQENLEIGIVGDGDQRADIEKTINDGYTYAKVSMYGYQPMEKVPEIMRMYDVLVLPSRNDGWGAVVNEALTLGLYVICSDHCGAKYLLKDKRQGLVFASESPKGLMKCLSDCIRNKENLRNSVSERIVWSKEHISGMAVAEYFLNSLR